MNRVINVEDYITACHISLQEMIERVLAKNRTCRILDLGSAYFGTFGSFQYASESVHIVAVDVIFSGKYFSGESPPANPDWKKPHEHIECLGMDIHEFYQSSLKYKRYFDLVLMGDVYSAVTDFVAISVMLKLGGIFFYKKFSNPGIHSSSHSGIVIPQSYSQHTRIEPSEAFTVARFAQQGGFSFCWACRGGWAFQVWKSFRDVDDEIVIFPTAHLQRDS